VTMPLFICALVRVHKLCVSVHLPAIGCSIMHSLALQSLQTTTHGVLIGCFIV
jgi:hypothetical protein